MSRPLKCYGLILFSALIYPFASAIASPIVLPSAIGHTQAISGAGVDSETTTRGHISSLSEYGDLSFAASQASVSHGGAVLAQVEWIPSSLPGEIDPLGSSDLTYYFAVSGPANAIVPLDVWIITNVGIQTDGIQGGVLVADVFADYSLLIDPGPTSRPDGQTLELCGSAGLASGSSCLNRFPISTPSFNGTKSISVASNTIYQVQMTADAGAAGRLPGVIGTGLALVDPIFTIDPTFADGSQFSLVFSDGIDNTPASAVPEPPFIFPLLIGWLTIILGNPFRSRTRKSAGKSRVSLTANSFFSLSQPQTI
jgi:hypothetical protein